MAFEIPKTYATYRADATIHIMIVTAHSTDAQVIEMLKYGPSILLHSCPLFLCGFDSIRKSEDR